jgi:two-component system nitrate/nitrite sensor histidine kinase NarX
MLKFPAKKLRMRRADAMATITARAFVSMLSSTFIADAMEGAATAINQAGTLRMQSYRITANIGLRDDQSKSRTTQLITEFEQRLQSQRLLGGLPDRASNDASRAYADIVGRWQREIKPMLLAHSDATRDNTSPHALLPPVDSFVADIDRFVGLLEVNAEAKVQLLRLIHIVALFLTLLVVLLTMHLVRTRALLPLRELLNCAESARHGDFSQRVSYDGDDELGQMGRTYNTMAEDLSKMYAHLEERVRIKTEDLARSNRALEFLYSAAVQLNTREFAPTALTHLLREMESVLDVGPSSICLRDPGEKNFRRLATTRSDDTTAGDECHAEDCDTCATRVQAVDGRIFPIRDKGQSYGQMVVHPNPQDGFSAWQRRVLETMATHIASALTHSKRLEQDRRLDLLEERSVIARELHDSLAQSLSYLKIQASRLEATVHGVDNSDHSLAVVRELREGISSAYKQLRELLNTFRLQISDGGLAVALRETVAEIGDRGDTLISLDNQLPANLLTPNQEIHVLQVIREALSNVSAHAHATQAHVRLRCDAGSKQICVCIEDNGDGIPEQAARAHHYGLSIMAERANNLGGGVDISALDGGGTRVALCFPIDTHAPDATTTNRRRASNDE